MDAQANHVSAELANTLQAEDLSVAAYLQDKVMSGDPGAIRQQLVRLLQSRGRRYDEDFQLQLGALESVLLTLRSMALTDEMTQLYNRRGFLFAGAQVLQRLRRREHQAVLFYFDVDNLKRVNDGLGHAAGDALLGRAAQVLRRAFRHHDVVGRLGGDEFAALMPVDDHDRCVSVRQRLREAVNADNAARPDSMLSLSVGCSRFDPRKATTIGELLQQADAAMYGRRLVRSLGLKCA